MSTIAMELEGILEQRLREAGAQVLHSPEQDLAVDLGGRRFSLLLRSARDARARILRGFLAEGVLEAQARGEGSPVVLPMVGAPSISDGMVQMLKAFVSRVAPTQPWGVVDGRGRLEIFGVDQAISMPPREEAGPQLRAQRPSLFTDVHQWLLKTLLAHELPEDLLSARREPTTSTRSLAKAADVSLGSAARFLSAFEAEGFLARSRGEIRLCRRRQLFEAWRAANRPKSTPLGMSWVISPSKPDEALPGLQQKLQEQDIASCLGSHGACRALGFGFVRGVKPLLYLERLDDAARVLQAQGVVPVAEGKTPDLFLESPAAPRSCFSGAVVRGDLRVSDVIQSWLDVSWHPARGREQADRLWEQALALHLFPSEEEA